MRIAISCFAALFITLALFYVMQSMIKGSGQPIEKPVNYGVVDFVRLQQEPAGSKSESMQRMPARRPATPPRTLPALSSHLTKAPPPATPQPELTAEPSPSLQLGKPYYLDPATAVMAKTKLLRKSASDNKIDTPSEPARALEANAPSTPLPKIATDTQASVVSSLPTSGGTTGIDVPTLPTGTAPELQDGNGNDAAEAIPIFKLEPQYPRKAARSRIEGWVKLEFTITESGTVSDPVVVDSKPRRTFDRSAIQSIRKWRFKPKIVDGRPVQRKASQVIEFRLTSG